MDVTYACDGCGIHLTVDAENAAGGEQPWIKARQAAAPTREYLYVVPRAIVCSAACAKQVAGAVEEEQRADEANEYVELSYADAIHAE